MKFINSFFVGNFFDSLKESESLSSIGFTIGINENINRGVTGKENMLKILSCPISNSTYLT